MRAFRIILRAESPRKKGSGKDRKSNVSGIRKAETSKKMTRHPERVVKMRSVRECLCCPEVGFTCRIHDGSEPQAIIEETGFPSEGPPWDVNELPPELQGYGHRRADQDGGDGEEWVSPIEDKEREFFEAARVLLDVGEIE